MDDVKAGLERYRQAMVEDWEEGVRLGHHRVSRLSKAVIGTRHFARDGALPAAELLRIAAEVTGVPLETMKDASGKDVQVWRPARGELGWLPYDVPPANYTPAPAGYED